MQLYDQTDYRTILKALVKEGQQRRRSLTFSSLAKKAGIQRTYLSHVLNGRGNLSADQLYLLATELGLGEAAVDYLQLLLEIERCAVPQRRRALEERRAALQAKHLSSEQVLRRKASKVSQEDLATYYSDTLGPIVHMALHVDAWRRRPLALAKRLGTSEERLTRTLAALERAGFVQVTADGYQLLEPDIHLPPESHLATLHAALFRMRAIEKRQAARLERDYFFTATFAATDAVRHELKTAFLDYLARISPRIQEVEADDVFHMNFDLFQI
jgi:uncharacterized protein (TIGR02147 family)